MNYKILVGEDSPSTQKLIQMSFPTDEFDIYAFRDGQEVMDSLDRIKPDAILLNLSLPRKDGYELGEHIRNQEEMKKVPLILIKEAFEPLDKERLETFEYEAIIQKPIDSEALVQRIRTVIEENKVPMTLPEEPVWEERSSHIMKVELDQNVRDLVKREILSAERELEKRIKARVLAELKMWFINNQKK
jgi:DNA-binding response OmpR family regulator